MRRNCIEFVFVMVGLYVVTFGIGSYAKPVMSKPGKPAPPITIGGQTIEGPILKHGPPTSIEKEDAFASLIQPMPLGERTRELAPPKALCFPVKVTTVHDGDTAKVTVQFELTVRYDDCWAPELKDPGGKEARDSAKKAEGKSGRLFVDLSDAKNLADILTFGRVVGELWLDGATESESDRQIRTKNASTKKGGKLGE